MSLDLDHIHQGDSLEVLKTLPDNIVDTVVTSPPYWGLRDYGVAGQMGLEKTPAKFISSMVRVFSEVRRVLKKDGTIWVNVGDSYASSSRAAGMSPTGVPRSRDGRPQPRVGVPPGIKEKDLVGIPWMLAFALRDEGWFLRQDIIWSKPNPMPESVADRCTKAHEYLFMLSKSSRYHYDAAAIRQPGALSQIGREREDVIGGNKGAETHHSPGGKYSTKKPSGWDTGPGSHGSIHRDGRSNRKDLPDSQGKLGKLRDKQRGHSRRHDGFNDRWDQMSKDEQCAGMVNRRSVWTISPQPFSEAHFATFPEKLVEPCILAGSRSGGIVLDPFMGAGTTALVALRYNRRFLGIELNPEYIKIAERRIAAERKQGKLF